MSELPAELRKLLQVVVKLDKNKKYVADLEDALSINPEKINDELARQPTLYAHWGMLHVMAGGRKDSFKRRMDEKAAEISLEIRRTVRQTRITEKEIENELLTHDGFQEVQDEYYAAKVDEEALKVAREAFHQRKDMLVTLATNLRRELDADLDRKVENLLSRQRR